MRLEGGGGRGQASWLAYVVRARPDVTRITYVREPTHADSLPPGARSIHVYIHTVGRSDAGSDLRSGWVGNCCPVYWTSHSAGCGQRGMRIAAASRPGAPNPAAHPLDGRQLEIADAAGQEDEALHRPLLDQRRPLLALGPHGRQRHLARVAVVPHVAAEVQPRRRRQLAHPVEPLPRLRQLLGGPVPKADTVTLGQVLGHRQLELLAVEDDPQIEGPAAALRQIRLHHPQSLGRMGPRLCFPGGVAALEEVVHHDPGDVVEARRQVGHLVRLVGRVGRLGVADDGPDDFVDAAQGAGVLVVGRLRQAVVAHQYDVADAHVVGRLGGRHPGRSLDPPAGSLRVRSGLVTPEPQPLCIRYRAHHGLQFLPASASSRARPALSTLVQPISKLEKSTDSQSRASRPARGTGISAGWWRDPYPLRQPMAAGQVRPHIPPRDSSGYRRGRVAAANRPPRER